MFNIPIINALGGITNFKNQLNQFKQTLPQNGFDPKQQALSQAQQMLNSGQMSQQQYNQILQIAGMLSGKGDQGGNNGL